MPLTNATVAIVALIALVGGGAAVGYRMMAGPDGGCGGMMGNMGDMQGMHARCQTWMQGGGRDLDDVTAVEGTEVTMVDGGFEPAVLRIPVGATVTWTNRDGVEHDVTSDDEDGPLSSPLLSRGETWSFTFTSAGTYDHHCTPHAYRDDTGEYRGMTGRIIVE